MKSRGIDKVFIFFMAAVLAGPVLTAEARSNGADLPVPMPTPTDTSIPVPVPTPTDTSIPVPVPTPTDTSIPVPMPTPTDTSIPVPMPTPTDTSIPVPVPTPTSTPTAPSFTQVNQDVLVPRCVSCHSSQYAAAGVDLSSYDATMSNVVPGDPSSSILYLSVAPGGDMPLGDSLPQDQIQEIYDWIESGAPNN